MSSLEQLENDPRPVRAAAALIERCQRLRKVPVGDLSPGDLRVLISQQIGLQHLVPLALGLLDKNPLLEAELYPGDLLGALFNVDTAYWNEHPDQQKQVWALKTRAKKME
ncbi:contact-dependent growth inhibition system immunity protein [Dinghuibacter silviterrae]|nr:contact-dependent growth inhibition system immunity protein [Dinghuibacter silviterrae]